MATTLSEAAGAADNQTETVTINVTGADATFEVSIKGIPTDKDEE